MISKFSSKKKEAALFIKYFMNKLNQKRIYEERNLLPANKNVYMDYGKESNLAYCYKQLAHGVYRPFNENYTRYSDILSYYINSNLKKEITTGQAVDQISKKIRENEFLIR